MHDFRGVALLPLTASATGEAPTYTADTSWYDSSKTEFEISTPEQLLGFAMLANKDKTDSTSDDFAGKTVKLTADIDLNPNWVASATEPTNVWTNNNDDYFAGTFDGQGHTISGMYLKVTSNNVGMFVGVSGNATIKNFALVNSYFEQSDKSRLAAICPSFGKNASLTMENVYCDAIIVRSGTIDNTNKGDAGGLVGTLKDSGSSVTVKNCVFAGSINTLGVYVGGIVANGNGKNVSITDCVNVGTISAADEAGGIIGRNDGTTTITRCVNLGTVTYTGSDGFTGDIIGSVKNNGVATLDDCYWINGTSKANELKDRAIGSGVEDRVSGTHTKVTLADVTVELEKNNVYADTQNGGWKAVVLKKNTSEIVDGAALDTLLGDLATALNEDISIYFQESDDRKALRVIGVARLTETELADYSKIEFDISMKYNSQDYTKKIDTTAVYTSIVANEKTVYGWLRSDSDWLHLG